MKPTLDREDLLKAVLALDAALTVYRPPPKLSLIEWADRHRRVASKTSASPGVWRTSSQPVAFGVMDAVTDQDTHTVSVMAGTQILKSELLINVAAYYICQDPSPILFVQPTQGAATAFSKERFAPTIECTPALRDTVEKPKARDSENTITHKNFPGGSIDFVGANSPTDLSSRPIRIVLMDETDKWPISAGSEGDPMALAAERASTYHNVGRAKFVRTCSPTVEGFSRIGREFAASDQRKCFVRCVHCGHDQVLTWASVRWDRDSENNHLPDTAAIACEACGVLWDERARINALNALEHAPGYGWRQTKLFFCCGENQQPMLWDDRGRSVCPRCEQPAPYGGHAGFHCSKLYSKRHRLSEIVREFLEAKADQELLRKWTNTAMAELWAPQYSVTFDSHALMLRAEAYGPDDLPEAVQAITGFADVQNDRLEVQFVGWGADLECWAIKYSIIHQDPAQPQAWRELDALIAEKFKTVTGRVLHVASFGVDWGGQLGVFALAYCHARRGRRIFACKGVAGAKPIWPGHSSKAHKGERFYLIGVDSAKEAIYAQLRIDPPEPGFAKPGVVHFPIAENFGPEYYEQLNSERKELRKRMGQPYTIWVKIRERNEVLDTFVGCLAMRKALPRYLSANLEYSVQRPAPPAAPETGHTQPTSPAPRQPPPETGYYQSEEAYQAAHRSPYYNWGNPRRGWMDRG